MSEHGNPGEGPEYGQQPPPYSDPTSAPPPYEPGHTAPYGQQPPQQPPYDPGHTAPYGQQPPQQPPYDPGAAAPYGQPGYGAPDPSQTAAYGDPLYPQYGQPGYGAPGGPPPYPPAPPTGSGGGGRRWWIIGGTAAVLVAAAVAAVLLLTGNSNSASATPADAARTLLEAGKTNDVAAARGVLCAQDNALGLVSALSANGRVESYSIGKTVQQSPTRATVTVTVRTSRDNTPHTEPLPVVKEGGQWKVCLSDLASGGGSTPSLPTGGSPPITIPSISIPPISNFPTGVPGNPCSFITDPETVALAYVGAAEIGETSVAQACVFQNSVPESLTASLKGNGSQLFTPTGSQGSTYQFATVDGTVHLAVTVTKESDGSYYVTNVVKS
jgi:Domain of unknown function (DUF4878)